MFELCDLYQKIEEVQWFGGGLQGDVTNLGNEERPKLIVIANDTRDNTLDLEQPSIAENRSLRWQLRPYIVSSN